MWTKHPFNLSGVAHRGSTRKHEARTRFAPANPRLGMAVLVPIDGDTECFIVQSRIASISIEQSIAQICEIFRVSQ